MIILKTILFVCTGNTCRSSMAEIMFREMLKDIEDNEFRVISAGTWAIKGNNASDNAVKVMKEKNLDLSKHSSTPLTKKIVDEADLILTMTTNHKRQILDIIPEAKGKVFTLKEYAGYNSPDISDPFGGNIEIYRETAKEIEEALKRVIQKIPKEI